MNPSTNLSMNEYQLKATHFCVADAKPEGHVMGLIEEVGEVAGVFKRLIRGDFDDDVAVTKLRKELGDALWYLSQICVDNGWKLSDVAQDNLDKLSSRQIRGVILGAGDNR